MIVKWRAAAILAAVLNASCFGQSATVWNGPALTFSKSANGDPTQATNQDRITTNVWITRGTNLGIFNAAKEIAFSTPVSPADTEWAYGALSNYATLGYTNWNAWSHLGSTSPTNTVGKPAVMHLIAENIYIAVTFTQWGMSSGAFAYQRSTAPGATNVNNIQLTFPSLSGAQFQFEVSGLSIGKTNVAQASGDLSAGDNWVSIATNIAAATNTAISIPILSNSPLRFFRIVEIP